MGSLSLVQGIFPTLGLNPGLPHCRKIPCQLSYQGSLSHRTEVFISQNPKTLKASLWTGVTLLSPTGAVRSTWEALLVLWVERPHFLGSWMIHRAFCAREGLEEGRRSKRKHVCVLENPGYPKRRWGQDFRAVDSEQLQREMWDRGEEFGKG